MEDEEVIRRDYWREKVRVLERINKRGVREWALEGIYKKIAADFRALGFWVFIFCFSPSRVASILKGILGLGLDWVTL